MIAVAAGMPNVSGSINETANSGPSPGSAPIIMPTAVPRIRYRRFSGRNAVTNPSSHIRLQDFPKRAGGKLDFKQPHERAGDQKRQDKTRRNRDPAVWVS